VKTGRLSAAHMHYDKQLTALDILPNYACVVTTRELVDAISSLRDTAMA